MIAGYIIKTKPMTKRQFEQLWTQFGDEITSELQILCDPRRVMFYLRQRRAGVEPVWAKMTAEGMAPGAKTDREFFEGRHTLDQQFSDNTMQLGEMERATKAMGFKPPRNSVYEPSLAQFPWDPRAFITGGRGEVEKRAEAMGFVSEGAGKSYDGLVKMRPRQPENPTPAGKLAPDLVAGLIQQKIAANPDLARVPMRDLAADVQAQHGFQDANLVSRPTGLDPTANALLGKVLAKKAAQKKRKK
jgi:hypothetical protein